MSANLARILLQNGTQLLATKDGLGDREQLVMLLIEPH